ncbi:MAG: polyhydroxybutyrate depolymerase [Crocinitomicaceae bacterium]|jgi:polyhydroxybutyrate depolymerase
MKYRLFLTIFCSFLHLSADAQQTINASITNGGIQRDYILYVPANYTGTSGVPLLFNFHGFTSNATQQMFYGDFRSIADTAGFIIVHPEGTLDNNGITHFNVGWGASTVDDVAFSSALIDSISAQYNIDQDRVYSTGMSNGGFMSFKLACELSDRIAGIASVTGSILPLTLSNCNALHSTPIMQIHGTTDGTVPYNGGAGWTEPIGSLVDYWANFNNCTATPVIENMPNISVVDGSTVEKFSYLNGYNCTEVIHFKITNGGHTWPGSVFPSAGTNYDINASIEVWNFLSKYNINGLISCGNVGINEETLNPSLSVYPNPAENKLQIDGLENLNDLRKLVITDLSGAVLITAESADNGIDISELSCGFYLIHIEHATGKRSIKFTKQ